MERMQLMIGRLLLVGVLTSFIIVLIGGSLYLYNHGGDYVSYQSFHGEPEIYKSIFAIVADAFSFSPLAIVQFGLLILVIVQILRVGLIAWLFMRLRDNIFILISLFILSVLIYSLIWR